MAGFIRIKGYPNSEIPFSLPRVVSISKGFWLDENNTELTQTEGLNSNTFYGQKVKIKIIPRNLIGGEEVHVAIKAKIGDDYIDFTDDTASLKQTIVVKNGEAISEPFYINPNWYDNTIENYNYETHRTEINAEQTLTFVFEARIKDLDDYIVEDLPHNDVDKLRPVTYRRNYEELIGLFKTDNSGEKDKEQNYENKFIENNPKVKTIVDEFIEKVIAQDITISEIKLLVEEKAKALWDASVQQVQSGNLDDRPLYWARNKMQTWLKRNPLFKDQIDLDKSIVKSGTELDDIIILFEEKSRNYTGIDFSKAGDKKKVLITGFDPFTLNGIKFKNIGAKIDVQNPSGVSALNFHGISLGNAYIQCAIVPVRYEDFDKGIIEKLVEENISSFDIMFSTSRNDRNFDIERFASKYRGAYYDNMCIGDSKKYLTKYNFPINKNDWNLSRFNQLSAGNEFYETTLPISKILQGELAPTNNKVFFDQSIEDDRGFISKHPNKGGIPNTTNKPFSLTKIKGKSKDDSGSGGDYLSNEIMYRATRKREQMKMNQSQIGHIHLSYGMDFGEVIEILTKIIKNATK